jgi:hypothetical protein
VISVFAQAHTKRGGRSNGLKTQSPLQHCASCAQFAPAGLQPRASAFFTRPKQASAMPARPAPNFLSAVRRETDCAKPLVSSSNWLFKCFLSSFLFLASCDSCLRGAALLFERTGRGDRSDEGNGPFERHKRGRI